MSDNSAMLQDLFARNAIRINRGRIFDIASPPKHPDFDFSKVEGMLLGLAIGDALGNTSEGLSTSIRANSFGEIRNYIFNHRSKRNTRISI